MSDIPVIGGYSMGQLVDKTLIAAKDLYIYNHADNAASPVAGVKKGDPIGVVYAWLPPNSTYGRSTYWFVLYGSDYLSNVYVPYQQGMFDVTELQLQGALTPLQEIAARKEANKDVFDKVGDFLSDAGDAGGSLINKLIVAGVVIIIGGAVVKGFFESNSKK